MEVALEVAVDKEAVAHCRFQYWEDLIPENPDPDSMPPGRLQKIVQIVK
jgi:hypothetical protein